MDDLLKLGDNLFKFELLEKVDKSKTFARLVEIDGEVYFNTQFKLKTIKDESIPESDKLNYKKPITTNNSILKDNSYTSGQCYVSYIDGSTYKLDISLEIAAKDPGYGED